MARVRSKRHVLKIIKQTLESQRWNAMCCDMNLMEEFIIPRIQFRKDMTSTLMCVHYKGVAKTPTLLTINTHWYLRAPDSEIRRVVRHELVHLALAANGVQDRHGPTFKAACKKIQAHI